MTAATVPDPAAPIQPAIRRPYLTSEERERLAFRFSLAMSASARKLDGRAAERLIAYAKRGRLEGRVNRGDPDVIVPEDGVDVRLSLKKEGLQRGKGPGSCEDLIMARLDIGDVLNGQSPHAFTPDELGSKFIEAYNRKLEAWDRIGCMLVTTSKFIYWEMSPDPIDPTGFWWIDTGKAKRGNRNLAGYPLAKVPRDSESLPASTLRWNSGGKQFYVVFEIPEDAVVVEVDPRSVADVTDEEWQGILDKRGVKSVTLPEGR